MANRPLAELIAEQNRLATVKAPNQPATVVRVLVANRYNGPDLKSVRAKVGDIIAVAGGRYADSLVASGFVEIPAVEEPQLDTGDEPNFADLPMAQLRTMAKAVGINSAGMKKAALVEALSDALSQEDPNEDLDEEPGEGPEEGDAVP